MKQKYPRHFTLSEKILKENPDAWMLYNFVESVGGAITYIRRSNNKIETNCSQKESYALECIKKGLWVEIQREEVPFL